MTTARAPGSAAAWVMQFHWRERLQALDGIAVWLIILGGIVLRALAALQAFPLHQDEALYGAWARSIADGSDPLLLSAWVDKPPLSLYLQAASLSLFGPSVLALRLPGMLASVLSIPLVFVLGRRFCPAGLCQLRAGWLAAALFATSPYAILFAPTAFTDPWLVLWLLCGLWSGLAGRPLLAGMCAGLAIATKQQGVLVAPLILAGLTLQSRPAVLSRRPWVRGCAALATWLLGFMLVFGPLMYWDSLRWATRPSFWDRATTTYGVIGLSSLPALPARWADWTTLLGWFWGLPWLSAAAFACAALPAAALPAAHVDLGLPGKPPSLRGLWLLRLYLLTYLALHVVLTFQPWDRYLLPLIPLVAILAGQGIEYIASHLARPSSRAAFACLLGAGLMCAAAIGALGQVPLGSDPGAYRGIEQVVDFIQAQPAHAIIYYRWMGWHFDFYLYGDVHERRWWGSPWKLADDVTATLLREPDRQQWLALPAWQDETAADLRAALSSRGQTLAVERRILRPDGSCSFVIYKVTEMGRDASH